MVIKMCEKGVNMTENQPLAIATESNKELDFKRPIGVPKKRKKQKVLDEDSYVEELGKIIQRDFFPDLEKLKAQYDYLEAVEKNDVVKLRELYSKYSGRKPMERIPSPATFETPANLHNFEQKGNNKIETSENQNKIDEDINDNQNKKESKFSLDQFLNSHTSQDNQSFEDLMIESEKKYKKKYSYLYNEEEKSEEESRKMLMLPSIEEQAGLVEKKLNVDTWSYKNKNYIMYVPDGVELSKEEELELNKNRREINHSNTRLKSNPFNETQSKEAINELAKTQAKVLDGKIGVDGKELIRGDESKSGINYSFLRSPSPMGAVAESPLMTWGQIEGTPFRLDGGDTPRPRCGRGPSFRMAEPARRERIALALAERVGVKHRDERRKAIDAARRHLASPSPKPNSSTIDRLATMSPAARKLATTQLKINGHGYCSPSPRRNQAAARQRHGGTPKRSVTPKLNLGIKRNEGNLTDDLLKIEVPKRQKAADFF